MAKNTTVDKVQLELILNGEKSTATIKQLQATVKSLRAEISGLSVGSDEFNAKMQELQKAESALKKVQTEVKGVGKAMDSAKEQGNMFKDMLGALTMARLIEEAIAFGKESVKAFLEAEQNAHNLRFAITNVGKEGGAAFEKLIEQSGTLQAITKFSDDDIQKSQTMLANLGLTSNQIEQLIPKVLDYASATGKNLGDATNIAIDAINGKTKALKDSGDEFDDTGSKADNFVILLDKLGKHAGAAGAEMETITGQTDNLKNAFGDFMEGVGEFSIVTLQGLADGFKMLWASVSGGMGDYLREQEKLARAETFKGVLEDVKKSFETMDLKELEERVKGQKETIEQAYRDVQKILGDEKAFAKKSQGIHEAEEVLKATEQILANKKLRAKAEGDITKLSIDELRQINTLAAHDEIKRREKLNEDLQKAYEKNKADYANLLQQIAGLEQQAELRKLGQNEREIKEIELKYVKLFEKAKGHNDAIKQLEDLRDQEIAAKKAEQAAKELEAQNKKALDRQLLEDQIYQATLAKNDAEVVAEANKWDALILKAEEAGLNVQALREAQANAIAAIVKKQHEGEVKSETEKNQKIQAQQRVLADNVYNIFSQMLELSAGKNRQFTDFMKGLALFQIGIDTAKAISSAIATGSAVGLTPIEKAIAITGNIALVLSNIARAKSLIESAGDVPKFAEGGATTSFSGGGAVNNGTLGVIGEAGPEWVAPNWMLNNPATANIIGMLEKIRVNKFADGGSTQTATNNNTGAGGIDTVLQNVMATLNALNAKLSQPIYGVWDWDYYNRSKAEITNIQNRASIG